MFEDGKLLQPTHSNLCGQLDPLRPARERPLPPARSSTAGERETSAAGSILCGRPESLPPAGPRFLPPVRDLCRQRAMSDAGVESLFSARDLCRRRSNLCGCDDPLEPREPARTCAATRNGNQCRPGAGAEFVHLRHGSEARALVFLPPAPESMVQRANLRRRTLQRRKRGAAPSPGFRPSPCRPGNLSAALRPGTMPTTDLKL